MRTARWKKEDYSRLDALWVLCQYTRETQSLISAPSQHRALTEKVLGLKRTQALFESCGIGDGRRRCCHEHNKEGEERDERLENPEHDGIAECNDRGEKSGLPNASN